GPHGFRGILERQLARVSANTFRGEPSGARQAPVLLRQCSEKLADDLLTALVILESPRPYVLAEEQDTRLREDMGDSREQTIEISNMVNDVMSEDQVVGTAGKRLTVEIDRSVPDLPGEARVCRAFVGPRQSLRRKIDPHDSSDARLARQSQLHPAVAATEHEYGEVLADGVTVKHPGHPIAGRAAGGHLMQVSADDTGPCQKQTRQVRRKTRRVPVFSRLLDGRARPPVRQPLLEPAPREDGARAQEPAGAKRERVI